MVWLSVVTVVAVVGFNQPANQDQLWGIISRRVGFESSIQDPDDVVSIIRDELSKASIRDWTGPSTRVIVQKVNSTRDWRNHLPAAGIKLEGGLLRDDSGNHMFLSLQRRGDRRLNINMTPPSPDIKIIVYKSWKQSICFWRSFCLGSFNRTVSTHFP